MQVKNALARVHDDECGSINESDTEYYTPEGSPRRRFARAARAAAGGGPRRRLHFPVDELQKFYHLPLKSAAHALGICEAALKRICRRNGIKKWPYRQLQSVLRRIDEESSVACQSNYKNSREAVMGDFLLPHEVESRRKRSVQEGFSSIVDPERSWRLKRLNEEKRIIIDTAHETSHVRDEDDDDAVAEESLAREWAPPVVMMGAIDVENPLDMLASICAAELSSDYELQQEALARCPLREMDMSSVKILSWMTETSFIRP